MISNIKATVSNGQTILTWQVSTGTGSLQVKWRSAPTVPWMDAKQKELPITATSYTILDPVPAGNNVQVNNIRFPESHTVAVPAPPPPTPVAPVLSVTGTVINWTAVSGTTNYLLAIVRNPTTTRDTAYQTVTGTSFSPPAVPGETVNYGLRTDVPVVGPWATEVSITWPAPPPPPPPSSKVIIGINDALGWGASQSTAALKAAHIPYARASYGSSEEPSSLQANGITPGTVLIGDTEDSTPLSSVNISTWLQGALPQADDAVAKCGLSIPLEVGNEMYLKGGVANPQVYAQMVDALAKARPTYTLLFSSFGDYQRPNGTWSQVAGGAGWIGDALATVPALKTEVGGFINHPYGDMKPAPSNGFNSWGPGALVAQHDQAVKLGFVHADSWWLTEYGSSYPTAGDGDSQATDCQAAYTWFINLGYVKGIFWFQFRDYAGMNPPASGAFNDDFTPRPVVNTLKNFAIAQGQ